ncbi:MAG: hypothetical protein RLZZ301_1667 [Bacteroidota bacterium]
MALVVLAGGIGSRFGGDKQIQLFGSPKQPHFLFEYACYDAMQAQYDKVFVIVREGMQAVIARQLENWMAPERFELIVQEQTRQKPWGTAHALQCLVGKWAHAFLVINADDYYGPQLCRQAARLLQQGEEAASLSFELGSTLSPFGTVARAICEVKDGYLTQLEEVTSLARIDGKICDHIGRVWPEQTPISMNAWLLPASFLPRVSDAVAQFMEAHASDEVAEVYLPKVIAAAIAQDQLKVKVQPMPSEWFGITYAADLKLAQEKLLKLEKSQYPTPFNQWM